VEATVAHLFVAPAKTAPMEARQAVTALAGRGLAGDRYATGAGTYSDDRPGRHLTLIASEAIDAANAWLDEPLRPGDARRNLVTAGVDLADLMGRRVRIGGAEVVVVRDCPPCTHLDAVLGRRVLGALTGRGGVRADVVVGGVIRVGDHLEVLDDPASSGVMPARNGIGL
jgi:MOSC domain-containing protein YiiM